MLKINWIFFLLEISFNKQIFEPTTKCHLTSSQTICDESSNSFFTLVWQQFLLQHLLQLIPSNNIQRLESSRPIDLLSLWSGMSGLSTPLESWWWLFKKISINYIKSLSGKAKKSFKKSEFFRKFQISKIVNLQHIKWHVWFYAQNLFSFQWAQMSHNNSYMSSLGHICPNSDPNRCSWQFILLLNEAIRSSQGKWLV